MSQLGPAESAPPRFIMVTGASSGIRPGSPQPWPSGGLEATSQLVHTHLSEGSNQGS